MTAKPVRWGIVGCGWVARDYVAPALAVIPSARLVAVCDPDAAALERIATDDPSVTRHVDLDQFLATPDLEAVYIATPNHLHRPLTEAAARMGKHVLCEKPMATTLADAESMVAACQRAGVRYATAFDQRFQARHQCLRKAVADGRLGKITAVRVHYACWTPGDWSPTPDGAHDNWRVDPARAGGGAFIDLAPHGLDLSQVLLGEPLEEVMCLFQRRVFSYPVDDGAALVGRFRSGALLLLNVAYNCPDTFPRRTLELIGTRAMAVAHNTMGQTPGGSLRFIDARTGDCEEVALSPDEDHSPFASSIEEFSRCLRADRPFPYLPEHDLHTMRLLASAMNAPPRQSLLLNFPPYVCTNCGFWQRYFTVPTTCPVCVDFRHTPPATGFEFLTENGAANTVTTTWHEDENGVVILRSEPALGIGPCGYLIPTNSGNVMFECPPWLSDDALHFLAERGGVRWLAASHPHSYGSLWRVQEHFSPETIAIQREDLPWTGAFRVTHPFDDWLELAPGIELRHVGGHFDGQSVLYWQERQTLFAGDMVKFHPAGQTPGISTHKAYNRRVPMSHAEIRRYREVVAPLTCLDVYTTFERAPRPFGTTAAILRLFDAQLANAPFFEPLPLDAAGDPDARALAAYRESYSPALAAGTRCFEFTQTGLDRLGLPLWTVASVGADGALSDGFGYGPTLLAAQASAWGEMVEWHHAREWLAHAPRLRSTFDALAAEGRPAVDPVSLCLSAGSKYSHAETTLEWVEVRRHARGDSLLVPVEFVAPRFADLGPGFDREQALAVPITNGLGAGTTFAHALAHGVLELLQRDGNSVHYRALDRGLAVDLGDDFALVQDQETRQLLRQLDAAGIEVLVKLADDSFGLANLYVVGYDRSPEDALQAISLSACGEAVHPDREHALAKALREFVSARARKAFNHGPLGPVRAVASEGYLDAFGTGSLRSEDPRALEEMQRWMQMGHTAFFGEIQYPLFDVRARVPFDTLPTTPVANADALLVLLTERLGAAGLEILYADFTPPGSPAIALKAIVPGLEVETMTYQRIGARNLRRLLARGSKIVGVGAERPPEALPVRLTPSTAVTFDGEPWLDPVELQRVVGPLYPLYREPGRHVIALLEEPAFSPTES